MPGTVLITGGSRGIGAATARLAAARGHRVAINYQSDAAAARTLTEAIAASGGTAIAVQADVADEAAVVRMFAEVDARLGPLTALVNSAGVGGGDAAAADFDAATLQRLMAVNVVGSMLCCREAVRRMSTRRGGKGGAIVNVSSMAATIGGREGKSAYAASKAAIDSFTIGLAREVGREGIRVNAIRPGVTLTDMTASLRNDVALKAAIADSIAMDRLAEPEEIAAPILWLLSPEASFISGCLLNASGGGFMIGGPNIARPGGSRMS